MRTVLDCVFGLMLAPEVDDTLDASLSLRYHQDKSGYRVAIRSGTREARDKARLCCSSVRAPKIKDR